jgi:predicted nucleic acid-binding protein
VYLVDTSVWIDFLRGVSNGPVERLRGVLAARVPFGITSLIYQEMLQGADSDARFDELKSYLGSQRFYQPRDALGTSEAAARLFLDCRRKGVTVRSTVDCLIAQIAIEHELTLLHNDRDFDQMAQVVPALRLAGKAHHD